MIRKMCDKFDRSPSSFCKHALAMSIFFCWSWQKKITEVKTLIYVSHKVSLEDFSIHSSLCLFVPRPAVSYNPSSESRVCPEDSSQWDMFETKHSLKRHPQGIFTRCPNHLKCFFLNSCGSITVKV